MTDFDDLNEPYSFDALAEDLLAAAPMGAPPSAHLLASGETGVQFESLVLFAEPLFATYELDMADAFALKADPDAALPEVLAVLETARMLWAFFSLPPDQRVKRRPALAAQLVGPDPSQEDWIAIESLLDTVEPYWQAMLPQEIEAAQQTGHPALDFDALLEHPAFSLVHEQAGRGYGPEALSEIEARALFAQPLLDDPATLIDDTAFEAAMERASAYWALAQQPSAVREDTLRETVKALANGSGSADEIKAEAQQMVERFHALFPER
ncbi:MAG: hypothetical protein HKN04_03545 [Rhodothermaceae bacterium]|nr:hypothetical protein [Rhodothermaceae bacterium]